MTGLQPARSPDPLPVPSFDGRTRLLDPFAGASGMGALIRSSDWSQTPIGAIETWSPALRMMVSILLANRFPLLLWWGPQYVQIYNDAYRPIPGAKHPCALGQPASECWKEIWHVIGPLIDTPFRGGPATWMEDILLEINRHGFMEESHFTIAYSPVPDETVAGGIGGVLATVHEISEKVIGERRVAALGDLGARVAEARTAEEACAIAAETLSRYAHDVPFALLYLTDNASRQARLVSVTGLAEDERVRVPVLSLEPRGETTDGQPTWPIADALQTETIQIVDNITGWLSHRRIGPWSDPPNMAAIIPIKSNIINKPAGVLVAGISSRLKFDGLYRSFFELVAGQIATAVANARAYEEERKRAEALAALDRAKTAFFSNVSHEFRTPLTLMLGPLDDLLRMGVSDLAQAVRGQLEVAQRNGRRLLRLVNTLLDFSRIEAGRARARYQPTDLAAFTAELASAFRSACERAGLRLVVDCPPSDPAQTYVDRGMWEKIVLNLISNAFKFTFTGEINVSMRFVDDKAELKVADTGIGIPAQELAHVFDRFHRVPNTRGRSFEGSGIGLALVKELVALHGGDVAVQSGENVGTCFTVHIPLGTSHLDPAQLTDDFNTAVGNGTAPFVDEALSWLAEAQGTAAPNGDIPDLAPLRVQGPRLRIVWADDNSDMRQYVRRLLAPRCDVEAFADGQAALERAVRDPPDLVLCDVMMPRLDGFGLLAALRANPATADCAVVLISARAGEESRIDGMQAGADDYIVKPFTASELIARVEAHARMARARRDARKTEKLLIAELNHRVKNTLASVQAIAQQTLRGTKSVDEFRQSFSGRIQAMARINSMLSSTSWSGADLRDIIRDQVRLGPVDETRLTAWGPPVHLGPQMAHQLAMVLHELGTNSSKYGALSTPGGWITVNWRVEAGRLQLRWVEHNGPAIKMPVKRGFGTTFIEQSTRSAGGEAQMSIDTEGVTWDLLLTLPTGSEAATSSTAMSAQLVETATRAGEPVAQVQRPSALGGKRFLVVEDESLVAMDIVEALEELGATVLGPAGSADEAFAVLSNNESIDAVLLDANLHGRPSDRIADALTGAKVPFAFVTGYGREGLPDVFAAAPVLSKPFSRSELTKLATSLVAAGAV